MKKSIRESVEIDSLEVTGLGTVTKGMLVKHPVFGYGKVVAIFRFGCNAGHSIGVEFEGPAGYKPLSPEHAKLERIQERSGMAFMRTLRALLPSPRRGGR